MNLSIFLDPVPDSVIQTNLSTGNWHSFIKIFHEEFPEWKSCDIALVGVKEIRGAEDLSGAENGPDEIRKSLYRLKKGTGAYNIADIGNIRNGENYEDTLLRLKEVCEILLQNNVIPVILGASHDLDLAQFLAYENSGKPVNFLNLDAKLDLQEFGFESDTHIHKILTYKPNFLFHYSHIAYQSFLVEKSQLEALEKLYCELYRLGQVRDKLEDIEPVIRTADLLSFDISAIKMNDAPGNTNAQPFGLSAEEACQICWYAGINTRISSLGIYDFNPRFDNRNQTAAVIATMVWYFVEGFYHRINDLDFSDNRFTRYIVNLKEEPHKIVFFKDTFSEKWWMEVPVSEEKKKFERNALVPCSYNDYKDACNGEIPNRWILTHTKLI